MINSIIADRYKICDRLGEGGTAITYKAVDLTLLKRLLLKSYLWIMLIGNKLIFLKNEKLRR